ncbi:MAG: glycosyltransferase family 4 protein, partial [Anaerococcus sp.]|uniref:glycosyltransferase family 4 protein n=1 Tax=Anaerococcus sp. TaxID=1872515 RepID=UPI0028FFBBF9
MKILVLANSSKGLFNFRKDLLKEFKDPGIYLDSYEHESHDVLICVPDDINNENLENIGCKVINFDLDRRGKNPLKDLRLIKEYKNIIRSYNPNIILTYTIKPNVYGGIAAQKYKIPYIPNITGLGTSIHKNNFTSKFIKNLYKIGIKGASEIFVQNRSNLEFFKKNIIADANYNLIPGSGINLEKFVYKDYPSDTKPIKFITVGRIMKDKGIDELLESIIKIKNKYGPKVEFHIAGSYDDVSYKNEIDSLNKAGTINYLGFRNDIPEIIEDYHCIIHPSYHEGLSNVLLEAGATATP